MKMHTDKLTREQYEKVVAHLDASGIKSCQRCSGDRFEIFERLMYLPGMDNQDKPMEDSLYVLFVSPMLMMTCKKCGNVNFHSASAMGLIDPPT